MVKNKTDSAVTLALDLRADPGLLTRKWQSQFIFLLQANEEREILAEYEFQHLWPEASLTVRFAFPEVKKDGITDIGSFFFAKTYSVGRGNKAVDFDPEQHFKKRLTAHFEIHYFPASFAANDIETIAQQRESAFQRISAMLGTHYSQPIRIFLFPNAEKKTDVTGHIGAGFAFANNIVEIYNETIKLDPYHELTHILAAQLGDPPAMFSEGLAVYVSESMGADALRDLGSSGKTVDAAVLADRKRGRFIPVDKLFSYTDIGPEESVPEVSYPEAASMVKYLVAIGGIDKFRMVYRSLQNSDNPSIVDKNRQVFKDIYGQFPADIEKAWIKSLSHLGGQRD